jgi:ribosomal protein S12 methylthiotransferase
VPDTVKQNRLDQVMTAQQQIAFEHAQSMIGKELDCLITTPADPRLVKELRLDRKKHWFTARHPGQAPEIDSECYLAAEKDEREIIGTIQPAKITTRIDYDLVGTV